MIDRKGREFTAHQAANDWISADFSDGTYGIVSPKGVECTWEEWVELVRMAAPPNGGSFTREWEWSNGKIKKMSPRG